MLDMTDMELEVYDIDEDRYKNEENVTTNKLPKSYKSCRSKQQQFFHGLFRFLTVFNECCSIRRTYILNHVNINTDLISKEDSEKRVIWLLTIFAFFQCLTFSILIITSSLSLKIHEMSMSNTELEVWPVVQKLVVIFGDGTTFFLVMNKSMELAIVQDQKFNFDARGFFAYDQINHIQTLVGNPYALNYMHYSKSHYKKISG